MKAGVVTVLFGLSVIGTVTALYFWPSSLGGSCPALVMTEREITDADELTREQLQAAFIAGTERASCLHDELNGIVLRTYLPESLRDVEMLVRAPFQTKHMRRYLQLAPEADAAALAAMRRDTETYGASDQAQVRN